MTTPRSIAIVIIIWFGLFLTTIVYSQKIHTHEHYDTWFGSLRQPDDQASLCCGPDDQFYAREYWPDPEVRGGFVVITESNHGRDSITIKVPPNKVNWLDIHTNPTGRGVIFLSMGDWSVRITVYCFVPGMGV